MEFDPHPPVRRLMSCGSIEQLAGAFAEIIRPLGMSASASGMVSGARALSSNPFHFINWPDAWMTLYLESGFAAIDPMPRRAIVSGNAGSWSEVMKTISPSERGMEAYRAANRHGFYEGFVTPVRTETGALGLVSVGGGRRPDFSLAERLFLQAVSTAVHNRAETLLAMPSAPSMLLSLRERECVALLRQGFTDAEIGKVLAIAVTTVRTHLENARRKVGARNRVELVARAA
jgi:LuxR family quorum sensing-dependent transcriptional regulator